MKFKPSIRMGKKEDLSDFERGMVVGARRAGLSISKTVDLLGFSRTTISRIYREESRFLLEHSDVRVRIWRKEHESMTPSCLVSMVQAGGAVMAGGIFSWHTLGPLEQIEHRLNTTAYQSIVADHVHPFMTTVYPSSDATSSRIMHHVTKLKSSQTGFLNMTMSSLY